MALKIRFGQYIATNSPLHRLDPRAKIICSLAFMIASFTVHSPAQLILAVMCGIALLVISHIAAREFLRSIRPVIATLAILGLFNLFFVHTGETVVALGMVYITTGGIWAALIYTARFAVAIVAGTLILLTTTPTALSDAFDALLSPLSHLGLPGHELAMVFSLMLRFIPTLADDAVTISEAQKARGASLNSGGLRQRAQATVALLISLFASAMRHANNLSRALDARCYEGGTKRTHMRPLQLSWKDAIAALMVLAYITALVGLS